MLKPDHLQELKKLKEQYIRIYDGLNELDSKISEIEIKRTNLVNELTNLRESEKLTINKIEEELGTKLDGLDYMKLL